MQTNTKIYVAWHTGLVGSALLKQLITQWYTNIVYRTHTECDLTDKWQVEKLFAQEKPEIVFLAAAKVWGILANNTTPATFIYDNLQIQNNIIHASYLYQVEKLLFLWSSCIYPKHTHQPIDEKQLLTGALEPTNEPYAIAKIAGIKMCQSYNRQYGTNFIACMPTNLYWPRDNFNPETSHVLPGLIYKFHKAKQEKTDHVTLRWDGSALREFLYCEDMAEACIHMMRHFKPTHEENTNGSIFLNIGSWQEISIQQLAQIVKEITAYEWEIRRDTSKPNGTPRKILNSERIHTLWWQVKTSLKEGIEKTYSWFLQHHQSI
jgi:GDP-L-fucose synthase